MKSFGQYKIVEQVGSGAETTVYRASREGSNSFAVKVLTLPKPVGDDHSQAEIAANVFYRRIEVQKKVAEESTFVAPILLYGSDAEVAWYVTHYYPNSAQRLIANKTTPPKEQFHTLIESVVGACLELKTNYGRSHGNLKPSNVLLTGSGKLQLGRVALSDPAAGDGALSEKFELADLRAIGELIYRLVYLTDKRDPAGWSHTAGPVPQAWANVFGPQAKGWFLLCHKLLDENLSLNQYSLERLALDLLQMKPKRSASVVVGAAVVTLLLGVVLGIYFLKSPASTSKEAQTRVVVREVKVVDEAAQRKAQEEAQRLASEKRAAEERAAAEAKAREEAGRRAELVSRSAAEAARRAEEITRSAEEAARRKIEEAEAEARRLADEKRRAEERAVAESKAVEEARQRAETAEKARLAAAAEVERLKREVEQRQLAEARARELQAELERREREKQLATQRAAEAERLRREAENKRLAEEARARELAAALARKQQESAAAAPPAAATPVARPAVVPEPARVIDAPAASAAPVSSRPKPGERWSNSLGMRFVPFGPRPVLCGIWEVRRKDYEAFVRDARHAGDRSWSSPSFKQSPSDPVVNVSFTDAQAFCEWLTELERGKGWIDPKHNYRLPTDQEWSEILAAGSDAAASPYSWGRAWPPPAGVGNYAASCSYDRFEFTAPVAQFVSDRSGIYDLNGNVLEICVMGREPSARGGSWATMSVDQVAASYRIPLRVDDRREDIGFRCVLDLSGK